jgi:hypothetical protein
MGKPFTNYSIDVRECLVRVGNELVQENRSQQDVLDLFCRSGYTVDDSTFSRLLAKVQNNEPLYAETKHSGAVKKLSLLQERIVIGFAYQNYLDGTPQEWLSLSTFAQNELQCNISPSRLIQRLHPRGVGTYLGKIRSGTSALPWHEMAEGSFDWSLNSHRIGFFDCPKRELGSFDVTYSQDFARVRKTIGFCGLQAPQIVVTEGTHYTNAFPTAYFADGSHFSAKCLGYDRQMDFSWPKS